jgi:PAS domain S-box-containing protein
MSAALSGHKPFVLFVEDDEALREHLGSVLSNEFELELVADGEAALLSVRNKRPDLIVTDIVLPGMDGIELVRLLRDRPGTASIPILMISGRSVDELKRGFEFGADAYLGKPYTESELRVRMRAMLKNVQLRAESVRQQLRAESERWALEERAALLESITDAFYALDEEWRVSYVNQRALDYFGLPKDRMLGKVFWDVFPQLRDTIAQHESERAVRDQVSVVLELQSPVSGRWLDVHAYPHQRGLAVNFRDITDRKRAETLLRESESRLRLMSDALPALVSYIDNDYRYRFCNRRYEDWFGVASADIVGRSMSEVLGEAAFNTLKPSVDRALAGASLSFDALVPYRTGGTRNVHIDYVPDRNDAGVVRGIYVLVRDITEHKLAELRLRESEARFRSLADNAPVMVWVTEPDGHCSFLSRSWYEFTGQSPGAALGTGWLRAVHPEDLPYTEQAFFAANEQRARLRLEYRLRRADGHYAWVIDTASPRFDEGVFLGYVGSVIDIQERREMEERLRSLNELLEQRVADVAAERKLYADLVEGTDAFVQVVDRDYRFLAINPASADEFERIYGVRPKVGDHMLELLADKPAHQAAVRAVWSRALAGEQYTEIREFGDPERDRRFYEMKFNSLRNRAGELIGAYQFTYDVTQRMRDQARLVEAQDALRQSQKMETLGQLTGGVAHDFNNLLTPIVGTLDLVSRKYADDPRAQRLTASALQAADRAKTLIQRLLAFARRQHLEARAVDLRELLHGIRDLLVRTLGPHIELSIYVSPTLPAADVDPNQLELALLNLAVNARDAMAEGGVLTIRATEDDTPDAPRMAPGRYVRISVQDTGAGMDEETLARAIEPFFTTKGIGQGTGLGLSMVHGLAAQSGGDFMLRSALGRGTTASLWLRVSDQAPEQRSGHDERVARSEAAMSTILLVDDEPLVRVGTAAMLSDGGYNVIEASSADEALQMIRSGLVIDAVVTDYAMPGTSGAQLARILRNERAALPILLITGFATLTDMEAGDLTLLPKPFRQTELLSSLAEVMRHAADRSLSRR